VLFFLTGMLAGYFIGFKKGWNAGGWDAVLHRNDWKLEGEGGDAPSPGA